MLTFTVLFVSALTGLELVTWAAAEHRLNPRTWVRRRARLSISARSGLGLEGKAPKP
jgi:hypothetical protein